MTSPKTKRDLPGRPVDPAEVAEAARHYDAEHGGPASINEPPRDRPGTQPPLDPQQQLPLEQPSPRSKAHD